MSDHTEVYLQKGGTVVMWLAPMFTVEPNIEVDLFASDALPDGRFQRGDDNQSISADMTLQGAFQDSTEYRPEHEQDLLTLFGNWDAYSEDNPSVVTWRDQVNRIVWFMIQEGAPFILVDGNDSYHVTDPDRIDIANHDWPSVAIQQLQRTARAGRGNREYVLRLILGTGW